MYWLGERGRRSHRHSLGLELGKNLADRLCTLGGATSFGPNGICKISGANGDVALASHAEFVSCGFVLARIMHKVGPLNNPVVNTLAHKGCK